MSIILYISVAEFSFSTLVLAGFCRIVEICFVLKDEHASASTSPQRPGKRRLYQHATPFTLIVGGLEIMATTEEELAMFDGFGINVSF